MNARRHVRLLALVLTAAIVAIAAFSTSATGAQVVLLIATPPTIRPVIPKAG